MGYDSGFLSRHLRCDVLVLNYNGASLLRTCLPSIVHAVESTKACEACVVLVDNRSSDDSIAWLAGSMPSVHVAVAPANDYLYSLNWAARQSRADCLLLMNNDVSVTEGSIDALVDTLQASPRVFSASAKLLTFDGSGLDAGKHWGEFRRGFLHHDNDPTVDWVSPTLFPTGAAFLVRRSDFLRLGGFDRLYHPGYWEDVDLGYRAWKLGYVNLWVPHSIMYHIGSASFGKHGADFRAGLEWRNAWLFTWRNVTDAAILVQNLRWTLRYYLHALVRRNARLRSAIRNAIRRWPMAWRDRCRANRGAVWSDAEICAMANSAEWR